MQFDSPKMLGSECSVLKFRSQKSGGTLHAVYCVTSQSWMVSGKDEQSSSGADRCHHIRENSTEINKNDKGIQGIDFWEKIKENKCAVRHLAKEAYDNWVVRES